MNDFKTVFLSLRNNKKLSQEKMAKELGVSKSTIAMWETGKRLPSPEVFEQIADYFNVDIDFLYGRTNRRRKIYFDEYGEEFVHSEPTTAEQQELLNYYTKLNTIGKQEAVKRVEELTHFEKYTEESTLLAAHNDYMNQPEEHEKIARDLLTLKRPDR